MREPVVAGLISVGGPHDSFLARMPRFLAGLGPVKASSLRVAARVVNLLRAGSAVEGYGGLQNCSLVWVAVPEAMLEKVLHELSEETSLQGKLIVICGATRNSVWCASMTRDRVKVATLNAIEHLEERTFVGEGDADAMREIQKLLEAEGRKCISIAPSSKACYVAGTHFATHLMLPWISGAVESLREAGFSRRDATRVAEAMGTRTLKAYVKAGRRAWSATAAQELNRSKADRLGASRAGEPAEETKLQTLYAGGVTEAIRYFETSQTELTEQAST